MSVCRMQVQPDLFPARATLELAEGPFLDITLAHSETSSLITQSLHEPSIVRGALDLNRNPIRTAGNTLSASPSFTMAEQILDQIRDVAEGQIVCFSSHPQPALPPAYLVRK